MIDPNFVQIALMTHTYFMKSEELLFYFSQKYKQSKSNKKRDELIRSKILKIITTWIEVVEKDKLPHFTKIMSTNWKQFQKEIREEKGSQIFSVAEKLKTTEMVQHIPETLSDKTLPKNDLDCLSYSTKTLAMSFTQYAFFLFSKIRTWEILHGNWMKPEKSPNYSAFVANFNTIQMWSITQVLTRKSFSERVQVLNQLVNLSYECCNFHNFHTSFAIYAGLSSSNLSRMKKHWKKTDKSTQSRYIALSNLFSPAKNHKEYQSKVAQLKKETMIPIIGIMGKFLFAIEENNPSKLSNGQLNYQKFRMLYVLTQQINKLQSKMYVFEQTQEVYSLVKLLLGCELTAMDDKALYELSLEYEPREPKN